MADCVSISSFINISNLVLTPQTSVSEGVGNSCSNSPSEVRCNSKELKYRKRKHPKNSTIKHCKSVHGYSNKTTWSEREDELLRELVGKYGAKSWKKISAHFTNRTDVQ